MKRLILLLLILPLISFGQKKKDLIKQLEYSRSINLKEIKKSLELEKKVKTLESRLEVKNEEIELLNEKLKKGTFETPENFAKSFFKLLKNKNLNEASKLLFNANDFDNFNQKFQNFLNKKIKKDSITLYEWQKGVNDEAIESFEEAYYDGLNMGIDWPDAVFKKATFKIEKDNELGIFLIKSFRVFFTSSNKEYYFNIRNIFLINDMPYNWRLGSVVDIAAMNKKEAVERENEQRKEKIKREKELNKPYTPYGLKIGGTNWSYNKEKPKKFTEFRCKITNDTEYTVDRVKFRVSIYTGAAYRGGTKVFSKTYDLESYCARGSYNCDYDKENLEILPGDMQEIQIGDLRGFFLGEDTNDDDKWYVRYEVLEVFPKRN
jgi:hypothetical protein